MAQQETDPMENEQSSQKEGWLKDLARQSWEPELLLSGIAIFAIMKFPDAFWHFRDIIEYNLSADSIEVIELIEGYIWLAWIILLFNFVVHFILRAYWVGLIGLTSVFPDGILYDKIPHYTERDKQRARERLPDINEYANTLDKLCSVIFAFSFAGVFSYLAVCTTILVVLTIYSFVPTEIRPFDMHGVFYVFSAFLMIPAILMAISNIERFKENETMLTIKETTGEWFGILLLHIFRKPIEYISFTFSSYYSLKKNYLFMIGYFSVLVVFGIFLLYFSNPANGPNNIRNFYPRLLNEQSISIKNYDNLRGEGVISLPTIQADIITDAFVKLFIPMTKEMESSLRKTCELREQETEETRAVYENYIEQASRVCIDNYLDIQLNDSAISSNDFVFNVRQSNNEKGVQFFIPTKNIPEGKNHLTITAAHFPENENKERKVVIPFWFASL